MYASEMLTLVLYLPLLIGDLVLEDTESWRWFLLMRETIDILLSKSLQLEVVTTLRSLIKEYLDSRRKLFPTETLKPKHHFLLHCPDIYMKMGPLINT